MTLVGRKWASRLARVGIAAILALLPFSSLAAPFSFIHIADTRLGQFIDISALSPTISSNGIVAFRATLVGGEQGIFTGTGGPVTTIADGSGMFRTFTPGLSVNAAGTVAFRAQLDTLNTGIFTGSGGLVTPIVTDIPGSNLVGFSPPTINDQGKVVFTAQPLGTVGNRLFLSQGGVLTTLYDTSGPFNSFIGTPYINSAGNVVFVAGLDAGATGIFVGNGGPTTTIVTSSGPFNTAFGTEPTLSDTGVVAFLGRLDAGGQGIFTGSGGAITKFVDDTDPLFLGGFGDPSINAQGTVAYAAQTRCSGGEILAGPDAIADRVVGTAGTECLATFLIDDFVVGTSFRHGLNNLDQVTGTATLSHGGEVVFRANLAGPAVDDGNGTSVPEPGTLLLLAIGLAAAIRSARTARLRR